MTVEELLRDAPASPHIGAPEEFGKTELWVREQLMKAGFVGYVADELVRRKVDWHQIVSMVDNGCPHELALEIVQ